MRPSDFVAVIERLKTAGKVPTLAEVVGAVADARQKFATEPTPHDRLRFFSTGVCYSLVVANSSLKPGNNSSMKALALVTAAPSKAPLRALMDFAVSLGAEPPVLAVGSERCVCLRLGRGNMAERMMPPPNARARMVPGLSLT